MIPTTISLEEARREFWDVWNGLGDVHTQEALEAQSKKMWAARKRLLKVDPEFRAMLKAREDEANAEGKESKKQTQSRHKAITSEAEASASAAMVKARAVMKVPDGELEEWIQKHRFKTVTPEEVKTSSKLVCPICRGPDRDNKINGKPGCIQCMHELVPQEDLSKYNRAYRRNWKKRRG